MTADPVDSCADTEITLQRSAWSFENSRAEALQSLSTPTSRPSDRTVRVRLSRASPVVPQVRWKTVFSDASGKPLKELLELASEETGWHRGVDRDTSGTSPVEPPVRDRQERSRTVALQRPDGSISRQHLRIPRQDPSISGQHRTVSRQHRTGGKGFGAQPLTGPNRNYRNQEGRLPPRTKRGEPASLL